jgi:putative sigma-54 modulation protein
MEVEFTARHVRISKALRTQAEEGLDRMARILGKTAHASLTFGAQRHLQTAELTVKARLHTIAATGRGTTMDAALRQALEHAEQQALRYRDRQRATKRLPKEEKVLAAPPVARPKARAAQPEPDAAGNGHQPGSTRKKARASIAVHSFPARAAVVESHIVRTGDAVAMKPMTIEEAVKDTEFRDRDLLVFRNPAGDMYVLHRRRDGQMELVEIP